MLCSFIRAIEITITVCLLIRHCWIVLVCLFPLGFGPYRNRTSPGTQPWEPGIIVFSAVRWMVIVGAYVSKFGEKLGGAQLHCLALFCMWLILSTLWLVWPCWRHPPAVKFIILCYKIINQKGFWQGIGPLTQKKTWWSKFSLGMKWWICQEVEWI